MMNEKYKFDFSRLTVSFNLRLMFAISINDQITMTTLISSLAEFDMMNMPASQLSECLESFSRQYEAIMFNEEVELDDIWSDWSDE